MRISVQNVEHVNWDLVTEEMVAACSVEASRVVAEAKKALEGLEPGERKTLTVKVGSITVARPK